MMTKLLSKSRVLMLTLLVGLICSSSAFAATTIVIHNADAPGVGFNDTTPATPVGGNNGNTLGQQRLNAFQFAASIWGATLPNGPTITISASWKGLECTANGAVLGSAGTTTVWNDFTNAPLAKTLYPAALANMLAGHDLDTRANPDGAEIEAQFNLNIGKPGCLENNSWYYGLDNNHGGSIDLVSVLLHEFGHGLGFASFTNEETGVQLFGLTNVFDRFLFDNTRLKAWPQMSDGERKASAINPGNLIWYGPQVVGDAGILGAGKDLSGRPRLWSPSTLSVGSSVSHWDRLASPNQLMEPNISSDLSHSVTTPQDLTFSLLKDLGWCPSCAQSIPLPLPSVAANNNFASAQTLSGCNGTVNGENLEATHQSGEPSHSPDNDEGSGSVWYQWQAPSSGSVTITTANSDYDTLLAVYTGTSVNALSLVARNDDVDPNHIVVTSSVTFTATAGTVYKIAVDGWGGSRGNIVLNWVQTGCGTKTDQTINFFALNPKTYGNAPFAVNATASSGLPVSFSVSGPASIIGNIITLTGAGSVTVTASQAGNAIYNAATPVSQTFTVSRATPVIAWNNPADITYGTALSSTQLNATVPETGTFTYTPAAGTILNAGANILTANFTPSNIASYNSALSHVTINVLKANQTINFDLIPNKIFGDAPFSLNATSTSGLPVSFQVISGPASIIGSTVTITGVGTVVIRATQAGNGNYNAAFVENTFNVANSSTPSVVTLQTEEDNIHAIAVDSVTMMRGPFSIFNLLNFSADHHTRVTIFTSNFGSALASEVSVQAGGIQLPVESFGTVRELATSSYIVVKLVDGLPAGDIPLTVTLRGVPTNTAMLSIAP